MERIAKLSRRMQLARIVIGRTQLPVVNEGDALFHIARFGDAGEAEAAVEAFHEEHLEGLGDGDLEPHAI